MKSLVLPISGLHNFCNNTAVNQFSYLNYILWQKEILISKTSPVSATRKVNKEIYSQGSVKMPVRRRMLIIIRKAVASGATIKQESLALKKKRFLPMTLL